MPTDTKHLRLMHRQRQFRPRLPAKLARETGKSWLVIGLHTDPLAEAQRLRDKINLDLRDAERSIQTDEAKLLRQYLWADDQERDAFEAAWSDYAERLWEQAERRGDEKGKQDAISFYKRITAQEVPLELNVEEWVRHAPVSETTAQARLSAIRRFGKFSRDAPVHKVDRRLAGRYVTLLLSEGLAGKSVNSQVTHLSSYWRFLVRKGVAQENPWREQSVSGDVDQERVPWSKDEVEALVQSAPTALLRDAVATLALMGLRSSELTALRVLDCTGGLCRVRPGPEELRGAAASKKRTVNMACTPDASSASPRCPQDTTPALRLPSGIRFASVRSAAQQALSLRAIQGSARSRRGWPRFHVTAN